MSPMRSDMARLHWRWVPIPHVPPRRTADFPRGRENWLSEDLAMGRRLVILWALIAFPFRFSAATGGPDGLHLHAVFHPVYILFAIGAILALLRLRSATGHRVVRSLSLALVIAQAAAIAGQVGEEIAVLQHGGLSAGKDVFEDSLHMTSAWVTIPGLLASQILLIALTIAAVLAMRAERRLAPSAGHI
jgi:hypothetical protein